VQPPVRPERSVIAKNGQATIEPRIGEMAGLGTHILLDLYGCDPTRLNDLDFLQQMSLEGVRRSGATIMGHHFKRFEPQGVSGVIIIAESHLCLHSWPEFHYMAMDYFTCGDRIDIQAAIDHFENALGPQRMEKSVYTRGMELSTQKGFSNHTLPVQGNPRRWFTEYHWDGPVAEKFLLGYRYAVERELVHLRSDYQDILVIENPVYGRMLFIDDFVMTTEKDEFVYHEMLSHVPLLLHPAARNVLIIGGGDGGLLREVLRHPGVESVDLVDIDARVVEVSRQYLPTIGSAFDDPRARLIFQDGARFVQEKQDCYDAILVDSTDPVGPGEVLFGLPFFQNCRRALRGDGIFAAQALSAWVQEAEQKQMFDHLARVWESVLPYVATVPTYPGALWTFAVACSHPLVPDAFDRQAAGRLARQCRYYNPEIHISAFCLPNFLKHRLRVNLPRRHCLNTSIDRLDRFQKTPQPTLRGLFLGQFLSAQAATPNRAFSLNCAIIKKLEQSAKGRINAL